MARKRAIISACLLGEDCRYDGKIKKVNKVVQTFKEYEIHTASKKRNIWFYGK